MRRSAVTLGLGLAVRQLPAAAAHVFPYVPTQILMPAACWNESVCGAPEVAYVFSQSHGGGVQFSALDYSSTVGADTQLTTVTSELPFLKDAPATTAFGAARTSNGSVVVYSGACDDTTGSLWSYSTTLPGQGASSTWSKKMTTRGTADQGSPRGPYFLGGTLAFSSKLAPTMDQPTIYSYGGMCSSPGANETSWQASANYTHTMMSLAPDSQDADTAYSLSVASTSGPRTPIAGFTLTQLPASITNIAASITQQAGFVLLGGHTQQAFINMSTAAVWSLPEQSWSYINIGGPDSSSAAGLAMRVTEVESRSGHTAVLTEDGASVVVLGGWVGDVSTPAEPQLVVLKLSQTYSSWKWAVPSAQPDGKGVYGHGAAMLPGNVMMVYGGWETSASGEATSKRQASAGGGAPRFFNVTSMSWSDSYTNPNSGKRLRGNGNHEAPERHGSEQSRRLGLGLGLGLGLALLLGVILATCLWKLRLKKRQRSRELAASSMAQDAQYFAHDTDEMMERDNASYPWFVPPRNDEGSVGPAAGESSSGYESLRGAEASLDDGHGRPVITRKPVMSRTMRGGYVPAETRLNAFVSPPGMIHPIMEDDEEDHAYHEHRHHHHHQHNPHHHPLDAEPLTPTSETPSDPFLTPTGNAPPVLFPPINRSSATPNSESHRYYDPDVQDWVSDVDAADSLLDRYNSSRKGRISPTRRNSARSTAPRDDESRSGSNLSDSNRSTADSLRRSQSHRRSAASGGFFGGTLLGGADHAKPGSSSSSSYNTARSGLGTLQAEGPSLLSATGPSHTPGCGDEEDEPNAPPSPSKTKPRRGWLGSLGRVFSQSSGPPPIASPERSFARDGPEMDSSTGDYEPRAGLRGELLRRKQGRQDWEADARAAQGGGGGSGPSAQENEWDIERAVEQRLVQVMFTVPKERLRVVNGGEEVDDEHDDEHEHETLTKRAQLQESSGGLPDPQTAELVDPEKSGDESVASAERDREGEREREKEREKERERGRRSHSTDDSGRRFSGAVFTAEAVRFEKPRGRVLQMVESIESLNGSQEGSPTGTPEK